MPTQRTKVFSALRTSTLNSLQGLRSLIEALLNTNPAYRLGCGKMGAAEIKAHAFFKGFDWVKFAQKELPAPYVPKKQVRLTFRVNDSSRRFLPMVVCIVRMAAT